MSYEIDALANSSSLNIYMDTNGSYPHLRYYSFKTDGGSCDIRLFEGTTVSSDGTGLTESNLNRASSKTDDGTQIDFDLIETSKHQGGGIDDIPSEWILKPDNNYLLRLTNNSGGAIDGVFKMFWYESAV